MPTSTQIDRMFDALLTDAEVKAIARNRGFPAGSGASRSTIKNMFSSTLGLDEVLSSLTVEELVILHMLARLKSPCDVSFFERIYHSPDFSFKNIYMFTFSQRYKEVLKEVRERLVKRGILLVSENVTGTVKLEQWNFSLPAVVIEHLPPVIRSVRLPDPPTANDMNQQALAGWLLELSGQKPSGTLVKNPRYQAEIKDGTLMTGAIPLQGPAITEWCIQQWIQALQIKPVTYPHSDHPCFAVLQTLAHLKPEEWVRPSQLTPILAVRSFGFDLPTSDALMEEGWKQGLLARRVHDQQTYYSPRLLYNPFGYQTALPIPDPRRYLQADNHQLWAELEQLPPQLLVTLNKMARLELKNKRLWFTPDRPKTAINYLQLIHDPVVEAITAISPDFQELYRDIQEHWGQVIIHNNLYLARISDFSLMVQFERSFRLGVDYVKLNAEWVAFRKFLLPEVEKLVKKSDFVIKKVKA